MTDTFDFTSPMGILGRIANHLFVVRHMRKLLITRNALIKTVAEEGNHEQFISHTPIRS